MNEAHMDDADRERWRGRVDAELQSFTVQLSTLGARIEKVDARQQLLELKVETIATKIGLYASLGAFLGGGLMSIVVGFFVKH